MQTEFTPILVLMLNLYRSTVDRIGAGLFLQTGPNSMIITGGGMSPLVVHLNGDATRAPVLSIHLSSVPWPAQCVVRCVSGKCGADLLTGYRLNAKRCRM